MGIVVDLTYDRDKGVIDRFSNIPTITNYLSQLIGHDSWFIAGSFADKEIDFPSDIDIFFYTEEAFLDAVSNITKNSPLMMKDSNTTSNAISMYDEHLDYYVQLIKRNFGTTEEIFDKFDINVCKKAIKSDGTRKAHPSSHSPLRIDMVNAGTFRRYFKYAMRKGLKDEIPRLGKELVDMYIQNDTIVNDYYDEKDSSIPVNRAMFKAVCDFYTVKDYAHEQAAIHAPELLI